MSDTTSTRGPVARADRLLSPIENATNFIAALFVFALMCLGIAQIVMRTLFDLPLTGYVDLVELSMAGMAFLGAAYTQRMGAHIRMELFLGRLRGRPLWAAEIVGSLLGMAIIGVLIWYSGAHFWRSYQLGDTTIDAEFIVWPSKLLVPLAFSLWFLRLAVQLAGSVRLFIDPSRDPQGVTLMKDAAEVAREEAQHATETKET
ncbi:TRAP transporter small permease subunit [Antarctobacter heliothermus]|uniref:TRAP transporter small permease protein n=1 Tax=Antarctobacter heliothermus TaxID=74033 RepID=A0A239FSE8_9RHOB|nr:TRAP transporter small permease [Antarctobacter heliothermus]SNS59729.1 TRAP-type mannitol/chloroaromatic compound transport system, small permease component [Antarctobacter heliothermus]